jgi:penicillin-binding protein 2
VSENIPFERLRRLWWLVYLVGAVLTLRLVFLQVIRYEYFKVAAEKNRTQIIFQTAPRGQVIFRKDRIVATSQPSFSLIYLPGPYEREYFEKIAKDFSTLLDVDSKELMEKISYASAKNKTVRLAENLSMKSMFKFSELKSQYPGIDLIVETKRYYPYGKFASHLLGYMGKITKQEWEHNIEYELNYRMDSTIGRSGIEKTFEQYLRGRDGGLYLEVDAQGRLERVLESEPWRPGADMYLTLDFATQKAAEEGLENSKTQIGAVVAIDPRDGDVLALSSAPDFDPNMFVLTDIKKEEILQDFRDLPEYNLAISGVYAPGSPFKIITSAAALESGKINPNMTFFCPGYYDAGPRVFKCWEKKGHGKMNFMEGMTHSCDVYFYNVASRISPYLIEEYQRKFNLGVLTGIAISGEKSGNVFGPSERIKQRKHWFIGDSLNMAIGQGEVLVTPIQMAQLIASVANGGYFWRPNYVDKIVDVDNKVLFEKNVKLMNTLKLHDTTWKLLREALKSVVDNGTGIACKIKGLEVFGKTGTAQNPHGDDNAWFIAYAQRPGKTPEIAVAVLVQHGQHGSSSAAPIARKVIEAYYFDKEPKEETVLPVTRDLPKGML